jgi:hypothetical protein
MIKVTIANDGRVIYLPDGSTMADIAAAVEALPDTPPIVEHGRSLANRVERYRADSDEATCTKHYIVTLANNRPPANGIKFGLDTDLPTTLAANPDIDTNLDPIRMQFGRGVVDFNLGFSAQLVQWADAGEAIRLRRWCPLLCTRTSTSRILA